MIIIRNFSSPELQAEMSTRGATFALPGQLRHEPVKTGYDARRLYSWEIIPREKYTLIHTFPDGRLGSDIDALFKKKEALKFSSVNNLSGRAYLVEWFTREDVGKFGSFCISFGKAYNWLTLSEIFLEDLEKDFYKRMGIWRGPA